MFLDRRLEVNDLVAYWVAQFLGGILAAVLLLIATNQDDVASTATKPSSDGTAFVIELAFKAMFVLVILQASRSERFGGSALVAIPLTLLAVHTAAIPFSGSSVNPARTFGPDLVGNTWTGIWIYFIAPPLGAALAWAIHAGVVRGAEAAAPEPAVAEALREPTPNRRLTSRREARTLAACRCPRWSHWGSKTRSSGSACRATSSTPSAWVNPAGERLVGDVVGRQFTSVVAPDETRRAREVFARKVVGGEAVTDPEVVLVGRDGDRVGVDVTSIPLIRGEHMVGVFGQLSDVEEEPAPHPELQLTPRQAEVLALLERGRSTVQIAEELHLSKETVRNHVRHLLRAVGVSSRLEAVAVVRGETARVS